MDNQSLWEFSLNVYKKDCVESLLLALQDDYGADINMLLFCFWAAQQGKALSTEQIHELIKATAKWRNDCVIPLRSIRLSLKGQPGPDQFRHRIKVLELEAEQWQQQLMVETLPFTKLTNGKEDNSEEKANNLAIDNIRHYIDTLPGVEWNEIADNTSELVRLIG